MIVVIGWVISVCFHEYAHALVAYIGGDKSVKSKGYLHFNPFAYTDIRLSVILPTLFILIGGIGLPGASVQIRTEQLRHKYWSSLVSAAGPVATFLFALGLVALIKSDMLSDTLLYSFSWLVNIEIVVLILNLLPIPGLDGFGIIEPFLSRSMQASLRPYYKHGFIILIALLWVIPGPNELLWHSASYILDMMGVHHRHVIRGEQLYRDGSFPVAAAVIGLASIVYFLKQQSDWYAKGEKLLKAESYAECLALMKQVLEKKDEARAHKMSALCYAGLSSKASTSDKKTEFKAAAMASIEKCLAIEPEAFENWLAKGLVCETLEEPDLALQAYQKSLELKDDFAYAFLRYCQICWKQKKFAEMLAAAEKRLSILKDDGDALFQKAVALSSLGTFDEAIVCFDKCLAMGIHTELCQKNKELIAAERAKHS